MIDILVFSSLNKLMDFDKRPVIYGAIFAIYRLIMDFTILYSQVDINPSDHILETIIIGLITFGLATGALIILERFDGWLGYVIIIALGLLIEFGF